MASSEIYNDRIYLDSILYFFSKKMYTISLKLYTYLLQLHKNGLPQYYYIVCIIK